MLNRIRIRGFKSLVDVDVELAPLVVLLGPNAAGKSNFLEALLLLSRMVMQRTLAEAFEGGVRGHPAEAFRLPPGGLPGLLGQATAELSIEADLSCADGTRLQYRVGVALEPRTGALTIVDEHLTRLRQDGTPRKDFLPRIERLEGDPNSNALHLAVRQLGTAGRSRYEDLGLGHTLVSNLQYSGEHRFPDFDRLRRELDAWRIYYLDPREDMRSAQPPREVADIGPRGQFIAPFLHRLKSDPKRRRHFDAVKRALRGVIPIGDLDVDLDPKRGTLDIRIEQDGIPFSSRIISEGTLRVLALSALAANPWPQTLVAFEEPENGVHPRRIDTIAHLVANMSRRSGQQVVVTTHSPRFAAAITAMARDQGFIDAVRILAAHQVARETRITSLGLDLPIFVDAEVNTALTDPAEERLWEALLTRGWIHG